ncbi:hypothetical protein C8R46DRAFT_1028306 [Mycena filopes]|nr:hypothetical protein C8R46DRAFT_1028306 [Mycena filopes]
MNIFHLYCYTRILRLPRALPLPASRAHHPHTARASSRPSYKRRGRGRDEGGQCVQRRGGSGWRESSRAWGVGMRRVVSTSGEGKGREGGGDSNNARLKYGFSADARYEDIWCSERTYQSMEEDMGGQEQHVKLRGRRGVVAAVDLGGHIRGSAKGFGGLGQPMGEGGTRWVCSEMVAEGKRGALATDPRERYLVEVQERGNSTGDDQRRREPIEPASGVGELLDSFGLLGGVK